MLVYALLDVRVGAARWPDQTAANVVFCNGAGEEALHRAATANQKRRRSVFVLERWLSREEQELTPGAEGEPWPESDSSLIRDCTDSCRVCAACCTRQRSRPVQVHAHPLRPSFVQKTSPLPSYSISSSSSSPSRRPGELPLLSALYSLFGPPLPIPPLGIGPSLRLLELFRPRLAGSWSRDSVPFVVVSFSITSSVSPPPTCSCSTAGSIGLVVLSIERERDSGTASRYLAHRLTSTSVGIELGSSSTIKERDTVVINAASSVSLVSEGSFARLDRIGLPCVIDQASRLCPRHSVHEDSTCSPRPAYSPRPNGPWEMPKMQVVTDKS
jgi:hypothetical protein